MLPSRQYPNNRPKEYEILNTSFDIGEKELFDGICIDNGAQRSVAGIVQTYAYTKATNHEWNPCKTNRYFRFGETVYQSLGEITIRIPVPNNVILQKTVDVISSDVPILFGLDFLDEQGLIPDNVNNTLVSVKHGWSLPLCRKKGHLYLTWKYCDILYTKKELQRLHLHFFHPNFQKLFNLIMRSNPAEATSETKKILKHIQDTCKTCQRFTPKPFCFKVAMPDGIVFNNELEMDLMFINKVPILHVVDVGTNFSGAEILKRQNINGIWNAFQKCWASIYIGYPNKMRVDAGSVFTSPKWSKITDLTGITLDISGVESHNSIAKEEKYHDTLRRIFLKIQTDYKKLEKETILKLTIKAMNDTMGPNGLVPSLLVFGALPRFPAIANNLANQRDRMETLQMAKDEMEQIVAEQRLKTALISKLPTSVREEFNVGDNVLVYREKQKPFKWTGPFPITKVDGKQIYTNRNGKIAQHSRHQVKHYNNEPDDKILYSINLALQQLMPNEPLNSAQDINNITYTDSIDSINDICITRTLPFDDPENKSSIFDDAKLKELQGLEKRKVWEVVPASSLPENANIISGRFVCAIINEGTSED